MSTKEDMMKCGGPPANAPSYEEAIGYQHNLPSTNMPTNLLTYEPYTPYPPMEPMVIQPQQLQQQPPRLIINQPVGPDPTRLTCPTCHKEIITNVEIVASTKTHIMAGILCLLGCWCCVCCPYCIESCQNTNHRCPNCDAFVGKYN